MLTLVAKGVKCGLLLTSLALLQVFCNYENEGSYEILFQLFTRKNPTEPQIIKIDDNVLLKFSSFNKNLPIKIYAHGFGGYPYYVYPERDGYLQKEDLNFFIIDWSTVAEGSLSDVATNSVPLVGNLTGQFVNFLVDNGANLDQIHLIGHSFGAHVCGLAGAAVKSGKVARITALDPNLIYEYFPVENLDARLDPSDAQFVDVIHTSQRFAIPIGHVEFFPNGGVNQPGCVPTCCCSHKRVASYFAESITTKVGFRSVRCSSWEKFQTGACDGNESALMGAYAPKTLTGSFYLRTNDVAPFAMG